MAATNREDVRTLRKRFLEQVTPDGIHPKDLEKLKTCDTSNVNLHPRTWDEANGDDIANLYLTHQKGDIEAALTMMVTSFAKRKELNMCEVTFETFLKPSYRDSLLKLGAVLYYGQDNEGNDCLWLLARKVTKNHPEREFLKLFFAYMLERHQQVAFGKSITIIFDLKDSGMGNVDMDVLKFQVGCFMHYFPTVCYQMLIVDISWILQKVWVIIKQMLSESARQKVKFVKHQDLETYLPLNFIPTNLDGPSTYLADLAENHVHDKLFVDGIIYSGTEPPVNMVNSETMVSNDSEDDWNVTTDDASQQQRPETLNNGTAPLKIDTSLNSAAAGPGSPLDSRSMSLRSSFSPPARAMNGSVDGSHQLQVSKMSLQSTAPTGLTAPPPSSLYIEVIDSLEGAVVRFSTVVSTGSEASAVVKVRITEKAMSDDSIAAVAFKVKSTAPRRYYARPATGIIEKAANLNDTVRSIQFFTPVDYLAQCNRDVFLVEVIPLSSVDLNNNQHGNLVKPERHHFQRYQDKMQTMRLACISEQSLLTSRPSISATTTLKPTVGANGGVAQSKTTLEELEVRFDLLKAEADAKLKRLESEMSRVSTRTSYLTYALIFIAVVMFYQFVCALFSSSSSTRIGAEL